MNAWTYQGKLVDEQFTKGQFGFVYELIFPNGKKYVGQKQLWLNRKAKVDCTKNGVVVMVVNEKTGRMIKKKKKGRDRGESDWRDYYGSCDQLDEDLKTMDKSLIKREILAWATMKGQLNRLELEWQLQRQAAPRSDYYNESVVKITNFKTSTLYTQAEVAEINIKAGLRVDTPGRSRPKINDDEEYRKMATETPEERIARILA